MGATSDGVEKRIFSSMNFRKMFFSRIMRPPYIKAVYKMVNILTDSITSTNTM